ncbi:MAG: hypothetical protein F4Y44_08915, partial [Chloroflexi bacterium]|nr:hypothetical protein [Chloroflexota bacterium]
MVRTNDNSTPGNEELRTLANILRLEQRRGYRNDAVIGGLDAFLQRLQGEIRAHLDLPASYADMPATKRNLWSKATLTKIGADAGPSQTGTSATKSSLSPTRQQQDRSQPVHNANRVASRTPAQNLQHKPPTPPQQSAKPRKPAAKRKPPVKPLNLRLEDDVTKIRGVSARTKTRLENLGISTIEDLLYHFPHRHDDFTAVRKIAQVVPGETQTVIATVWEVMETGRGRSKNAQAVLGDDTGNIRVVWFNQAYLVRTLKPGMRIVISGVAKVYRGRVVFQSPDYDIFDEREGQTHAGRLVPIYSLTDGLYQRTIRRAAKQALNSALPKVREYVPDETLRLYDLMGLRGAIACLHYPDSLDQVETARRRIAFDELLMLQLVVARRRLEWQSSGGAISLPSDDERLDAFLASLPYALTNA